MKGRVPITNHQMRPHLSMGLPRLGFRRNRVALEAGNNTQNERMTVISSTRSPVKEADVLLFTITRLAAFRPHFFACYSG